MQEYKCFRTLKHTFVLIFLMLLTLRFSLTVLYDFLTFFPGPEPPTDLMFSNITETSLSVSWTKPKSILAEFKVTYTNIVTGTVNVFEFILLLCYDY